MTDGWATVVVTHDGAATRAISAAGYDVYAPSYHAVLRGHRMLPNGRRVRSRTDSVIERPLFPGYVFVRLEEQAPWGPIARAQNVVRVITDAWSNPVILRHEVIEELRQAEAEGVWDEALPVDVLRQRMADGETLFVAPREFDGTGLVGQLQGIDDKGRATILLEVLGQATMTVDGRTLRVVNA